MYQGMEDDLFSVIQTQLASISNLISQQAQHGSPLKIQGQSSNYQEQESSSNFEETVITLLEDTKMKNEAKDHLIFSLE